MSENKFENLGRFAVNLNERAAQGKLDPVIGRDEEIRRVLQILSRRTKNNPILVGEPGVGKTAISEGIAQKIVDGDVPENLKSRLIYSLDLGALIREKFQGLTPMVCANLPYNITTPVLTKLLDIPELTAITVLIQKEAAQRICARPGTPDVSAFSLQMQYQMEMETVLEVPKECFYPVPKVTSAVLRCVRRPAPAVTVKDEALFQKVLQGAYLLRRKTLLNSLASALPRFSKDTIRQAILAAGLPETVRGEQLTLENLAALSDFLTVA